MPLTSNDADLSGSAGYVLRASDQRTRASMRVQAIGVFLSYVTAIV